MVSYLVSIPIILAFIIGGLADMYNKRAAIYNQKIRDDLKEREAQ